jgi:hypothetical protein
MAKPRSDSKLFTLPIEDQLWAFELLKRASYKQAQAAISKKLNIEISIAALSNAWNEWSRKELEERVLKSKGAADDVLQLIDNPDQLDAALALALKQSAFEMVMQGGDPKTIKNFCTILLNDQKLKHDQAALDLKLRQYEDQIAVMKNDLAKGKASGGMTVEAIEQMEANLKLL